MQWEAGRRIGNRRQPLCRIDMSHAHHHAVQFYRDDASLFSTVAGFIGDGLTTGHPAIVIATEDHTPPILDLLRSRRIDVDAARHDGDLIVLDASETLALFMADRMPNARAFELNVGRYIDQITYGRPTAVVHAYGEMVDVLWKGRQPEAAIRLEVLWNKLAAIYGFALLCGYAMGSFYKQPALYDEVCRQHTHIVDASRHARPLAVSRLKRARSA